MPGRKGAKKGPGSFHHDAVDVGQGEVKDMDLTNEDAHKAVRRTPTAKQEHHL